MLGVTEVSQAASLCAAPIWPHQVTEAPHASFRLDFEGPHSHLCAAVLDSVPIPGSHPV